jgi:hypothetical protein
MVSNLWNVLARLEKRSKLERSGRVSISRKGMMLAITYETGLFFNILLKAMSAKLFYLTKDPMKIGDKIHAKH